MRPKRLDDPQRLNVFIAGNEYAKLMAYSTNQITGRAFKDSRSPSRLIEALLRDFFENKLPARGELQLIEYKGVSFYVYGKIEKSSDPLATGDSPAETTVEEFSVYLANEEITNFLDSETLEALELAFIHKFDKENQL